MIIILALQSPGLLAHPLENHEGGSCEFDMDNAKTEEIVAGLKRLGAPCIKVTMDDLAIEERLFLLQDGGEVKCEFDFLGNRQRPSWVQPGDSRFLHFSILSRDSDTVSGKLVVRKCNIQLPN